MAIERRRFLTAAAATPLLAAAPAAWIRARAAAPPRAAFLSARGDGTGQFFVSGFDAGGRLAFDLPLPARGHSLAVDPAGHHAIAFGRRPETFARAIDLATGRIVARFAAARGRHFYGHGAFSPDGRYLYSTENDYDGARGVIGVYDAANGFLRVGEFPSHGIGPHEVRLMPDGESLAVANGGLETHPKMSRIVLNVPTMKPNLALVDRRTGALRRKTELPAKLHRASIRHLSIAADGRIAIGMQDQGPAGAAVPLVAVVAPDGGLSLFDIAQGPILAMRRYCGSIEFDRTGTVIAASSPRGGVVTFWEASGGRPLSVVRIADVCGLAPFDRAGRFLATSGTGRAVVAEAFTGRLTAFGRAFPSAFRWDNHLVRVGFEVI